MELMLDFSSHLPQHLTPSYDKVVSLLTQTVIEWPKGAAMLSRAERGVFTIKVWDRSRGEKLLNKKIEYFYEGDKSSKKVSVKIVEKPKFLRYTKPKYVTITGFSNFPADQMENEQLDRILENYGTIIIPTQDVYAEIFLTGKKKLRIELDKGKEIPRDLFADFTSQEGKKHSVTLRCYYKDQPYKCKECKVEHRGDCPEWLKQKEQKEAIKQVKAENSKTIMVGDSNFRCINENGVMASVTAITGGEIGHITNVIEFESVDKMENVVLSAGQNCINDVETIGKGVWENRTMGEINNLERVVGDLTQKGKKVFLLSVPPAPCTQISKVTKEARTFINNNLSKLAQRTMAKKSTGMAAYLEENDGNYNQATDFVDDKHLSPIAIERRISLLDEILPEGHKLKSLTLNARPTTRPYRGCYGTYPTGCNYCTRLNHNEHNCPEKKGEKSNQKRNLSDSGHETPSKSAKKQPNT